MNAINLIITYVIFVNLLGFALMGIDKRKAVKHLWRIPEAVLFIVAVIGAASGVFSVCRFSGTKPDTGTLCTACLPY